MSRQADFAVEIVGQNEDADFKMIAEGAVDLTDATTGDLVVVDDAGNLVVASPVSRLLAEVVNNDATAQVAATHSTAGTWQAIDATRLPAITFTVPADGQIDVEYEALGVCEMATSATTLMWGVLESGSIVAASTVTVVASVDEGISIRSKVRTRSRITGLTPGAVKSWTWAHRKGVGAGTASTNWGGPGTTTGAGTGRISIWTVPSPLA